MKKSVIAMAILAAGVMASCGKKDEMPSISTKTPVAKLNNQIDSVCYAYGMAQGRGLVEYVTDSQRGLGIDSTYIDDFLKGLTDGAMLSEDADKKVNAYYNGIALGLQIRNQVLHGLNYELSGSDEAKVANMNDFVAGFLASVKGEKTAISAEGLEMYIQQTMMEIRENQKKLNYGEWKQQNEAFMAEIAKKEGIKALADGVYYEVVEEGKGATPKLEDKVKVNYEGKDIEGNIFDSSYQRGEPIEFGCTQVISGWTEALTHMPVGSKWIVYIPQEQAYGENGAGASIKPYSALTFTIELLDIVK